MNSRNATDFGPRGAAKFWVRIVDGLMNLRWERSGHHALFSFRISHHDRTHCTRVHAVLLHYHEARVSTRSNNNSNITCTPSPSSSQIVPNDH